MSQTEQEEFAQVILGNLSDFTRTNYILKYMQ